MKTTFCILLALSTLNLSSCKEDTTSEPIVINNYFSFVTSEGGDFFESDERYNVQEVSFKFPSIEEIKLVDGKNVFATGVWSTENIIDFGNGDKDTLKMEWFPSIYGDGINSSTAEELEKVIYTYNGVVIDTWSFDSELEFFFELVRRNAVKDDENFGSSPIIIQLPKTADEDELE